MASKDIQESQQSSQGITIGTQGNQGGSVPDGMKGSHQPKEGHDDRHIPNQDRSSASNQRNNEEESSRH